MLGIPRTTIAERFNEIVEFAGVHEFIDTPVKHYSSGMYLRLAFSVVVNVDADILLFDEVLSVGDLSYQIKCLKKIRELSQQNKTILFVGHNVSQISEFCQTIIWIDNGGLKNFGSKKIVDEYYEDSHKYAASKKVKSGSSNEKFENLIAVKWEENQRPGDESIKILEMFILNETRPSKDDFLSSDVFSINIVYEKFTDNDFFDIGFILSNVNFPFLGGHSLISNIEIEKITEKGKYLAKAFFEKDFFNETILQVGYSVSKNNMILICSDFNVLQFKIELKIDPNHFDYYKNVSKSFFPLRPRLIWEINKQI